MTVGDTAPLPWHIRPFEMADYEAVFALWQSAGPGVQIRPSDSREEVAKRFSRDRELFLVAERAGTLVGVVMGGWDGRRGWVHHLTVAPDARGCGIGRSLVGALEAELARIGCLKVNLLVRQGNLPAVALYRALGYAEMADLTAMGKEL